MARHLYRCPLRWADMDIYGVINNVVYLRLLEEARVDMIWRLGSMTGDAFFSGGSVVVRHSIEYKNTLVHRHEPIDIEMWVSRLQGAAVTIDYEVKDKDIIYAVASTTMAPYSYEGKYPRRLTEEETRFFEKYLEEREEYA